ncbi:MAG TPA: hypothetical protein VJR47_18290 [Stellaceae bacterium]|nr:hypothetical protein [Stellaceae bacterium]
MTCMRITGASIVSLLIAFTFTSADARNARHYHYHHYRHTSHEAGNFQESYQARNERRYARNSLTSVRRARNAGLRSAEACKLTNDGHSICRGSVSETTAMPMDADGNRAYAMIERNSRVYGRRGYAMVDQGTLIGSRPSGCPHAYCGCGLRKYLGLSDARLNLASNWARYFPHEAGPRAGLAAVRNHHVMYIEAAAGNGEWVVRDYNSGGGMSRVHVRDVRGYTFVNPHGSAMASR